MKDSLLKCQILLYSLSDYKCKPLHRGEKYFSSLTAGGSLENALDKCGEKGPRMWPMHSEATLCVYIDVYYTSEGREHIKMAVN